MITSIALAAALAMSTGFLIESMDTPPTPSEPPKDVLISLVDYEVLLYNYCKDEPADTVAECIARVNQMIAPVWLQSL